MSAAKSEDHEDLNDVLRRHFADDATMFERIERAMAGLLRALEEKQHPRVIVESSPAPRGTPQWTGGVQLVVTIAGILAALAGGWAVFGWRLDAIEKLDLAKRLPAIESAQAEQTRQMLRFQVMVDELNRNIVSLREALIKNRVDIK